MIGDALVQEKQACRGDDAPGNRQRGGILPALCHEVEKGQSRNDDKEGPQEKSQSNVEDLSEQQDCTQPDQDCTDQRI